MTAEALIHAEFATVRSVMAIRTKVEVICDGGDGGSCCVAFAHDAFSSKSEAAETITKNGWRIVNIFNRTLYFCPDCQNDLQPMTR